MTFRTLESAILAVGIVFAVSGCATHREIQLDSQNPTIRYSSRGIFFGEDRVDFREVPEILEDYDIPHDRVIHIRLDHDVKDLREARALMANLAKNGYTRSVLVTERHAESVNMGKKKPQANSLSGSGAKQPRPPAKIRYKKAGE